MAGSLTDAGENALLDHLLGVTALTSADRYVALFTVAPTDAGGGTEVTGGGYGRVLASFAAASGGATSNDADIDYGTASADWGTVVAIGVFTAASGGTMLAWADLAASKTVSNGDGFKIPAGSLAVSLS